MKNIISNIIKRDVLLSYFIICFLLMGIISSIFLIKDLSLKEYGWLFLLGTFTPTLAAVIVTGVKSGKTEIRELFKGWTKWKMNEISYLIALSPIIIILIVIGFFYLFGGQVNLNLSNILSLIIFALLVGPIGEETGWRGFALPKLQSRYSAIKSTLILGTIWSVFHLPLWFVRDSMQTMPFWLFYVLIVASSFIYTYLYNNSGGSLLTTCLFHFSFNFVGNFIIDINLVNEGMYFYVATIFYLIYAVILVKSFGLEKKVILS